MKYITLFLLLAAVACQTEKKADAPPVVDSTYYPPPPGGADSSAVLDSTKGNVQRANVNVDGVTPNIIHQAMYHPVYLKWHAPDSTVWLKSRVYVRNFKTADRVAYTYFKDGALITRNIKAALRDSVQASAPDYGNSAVYRGCAQLWLGGDSTKASPSTPSCWNWTWTRPATPDAVLDSIVRLAIMARPLVPGGPFVVPAGGVATDANRAQVCAFFVMKDGSKKKAINSDNNQICEELYQQFLTERTG